MNLSVARSDDFLHPCIIMDVICGTSPGTTPLPAYNNNRDVVQRIHGVVPPCWMAEELNVIRIMVLIKGNEIVLCLVSLYVITCWRGRLSFYL